MIVTEYGDPATTATLGPRLADLARRAEAAGFASFVVTDHLFQAEWPGAPRTVRDPMLECYGVLSFVAGATTTMRLGAMVSPVTFREPGLLAKQVTTLDVLSGGRAMLGIGAGWYEREHAGLGIPYGPLAERFERLEEAVRIVRQMWSDDDGPFAGQHYHLAETIGEPRPISRPHPPILIGGAGERKTLRLVARYADACNLYDTPELSHKLDVLRAHCEALGRDPAELTRTVQLHAPVPATGDDAAAATLVDKLRGMAALGIDEAILIIPQLWAPGVIERFGREIVPAAAGMVVVGR